MSMGRGDSLFTVSSELRAGDRREDWSGASGMPVHVGDTIIGIVKDVPDNYENRTLRVVPAFLLRAQRAFLKAIGTHPPELLDRARELIARVLGRSEEATWSLKRHLAVQCGSLAPCREVLADKALRMPLRDLVNTALKAKEELLRSGDEKGAEVVTQLVLAVLPTGTDPAKMANIDPTDSGSGNALIRLDVHSPTLAEILMAAADRRGACFRSLRRSQDTAIGEGALGHVLEGGRDPAGAQRLRDLTTELIQLFEASFSTELDRAFFDHLRCIVPEYMQNPGPDPTEEERRQFEQDLIYEINDALQARAVKHTFDGRGFTYYLVVETPRTLSESERADRDRVFNCIKQRFPHIAVLFTPPKPPNPIRELRDFGQLNYLLYKEAGDR
jgi:hypothetical protein